MIFGERCDHWGLVVGTLVDSSDSVTRGDRDDGREKELVIWELGVYRNCEVSYPAPKLGFRWREGRYRFGGLEWYF